MVSKAASKSKSRLYYGIQLAAALAGTILSLYLFVQHTQLREGIQDSASFCSFASFADCDVVNASQFSKFLGIPLAAIGAAFYFFIVLALLAAPPTDRAFAFVQAWLARLTALGLGLELILLLIQIFTLKTVCLFCLLTYVATGLVFWGGVRLLGGLKQALVGDASAGIVPLHPQAFLAIPGLGAFLLMLWFLPAHYRIRSQTYAMIDNAVEQFYIKWKEQTSKDIVVKPGDGTFGNPAAKVKIVEFSDFQCPHCRKAAFTLHTLLQPLRDRVLFVFKHYPLDSSCNPALQYQLHPQACKLARLAYCAEKKGKFWELHDTVFLDLDEQEIKEGIDAIAPHLGSTLTKEEIASCLQDPKSLENLSADVRLGTSLGIRGTPAIFVNGKLVTIPLTVESLNRLVRIEEGGR